MDAEKWVTDGWTRAVEIEPRLAELEQAARDAGRMHKRGVDGFIRLVKGRFIKLVGWGAAIADKELKSEQLYSAVYFHLLAIFEAAQKEARLRQVPSDDEVGIAWCERIGRKFDQKRSKSGGRYATRS